MRAAVVDDARGIGVASVPRPTCGPGEVRIMIDACGLCGSDLHAHRSRSWTPGLVPGHEIAGRIDAVGDDLPAIARRRGLAVGQAVVVEPLESCRACLSCDQGRDATCPALQIAGIHRPGGFAEAIVLPAERVHRVPEGVPPRLAALAEPLAVSLHGLDRGGFRSEDRVLVLGGGTIGILTACAARLAGAREVVVRARYADQRARVAALADAEARDANRSVDEDGLTGRFDLILETVGGRSETLAEATRAAAPGARIVVLGLFDAPPKLPPLEALAKEISVHFSNCYRTDVGEDESTDASDFSRAVALLARHGDRFAPLVTHETPLSDVARAFEIAADKHGGVGKLLVVPSGASESAWGTTK